MKYKSVIVPARGGPEVLEIVEMDLLPPGAGDVLVRIMAAPLTQDDVAVRVGNRPWLKEPPFVPGYSVLGVVEAVGEGVNSVGVGERVVSLTNFGGHAQYITLPEEKLVHVPENLDPAEAVVLVLNYLVAYQILHRVAKVKEGDKVLIVGASGGCGTAFLQLGVLAGLKMYGLASPSKHDILREYGAIPIDYHTQDFVDVIGRNEPQGIDYVFNGMGEDYMRRGMAVLKRGGALVQYGAPQTKSGFYSFLAQFLYYNLLPNGKRIYGYGTHRLGVELFAVDWKTLFELLEAGQIKPVIARRFSLHDIVAANELMGSGQVTGNVVILPSADKLKN
ncbi:MAG: medium chain dehydrogenase/reductase family protein [Candidatus Promineifilaceae bacterium]|jgi:NADPH:quinone reductase-like Zn-dependent oxidoreductase